MDIREPRFIADFPSRVPLAAEDDRDRPDADLPRGEPGRAGAPLLARRGGRTRSPAIAPSPRASTRSAPSLRPIRAMADEVIDTTVAQRPRAAAGVPAARRGRRAGLDAGADVPQLRVPLRRAGRGRLVFDVRFLKNPHWVPALRPQTGQDRAVADYMRRQPLTRRVPQAARRVPALRRAALRRTKARAYLDGRDRLHRRPASIGVHRRGAQARVSGDVQRRHDHASGIATWGGWR